jgi:hypothetical protein
MNRMAFGKYLLVLNRSVPSDPLPEPVGSGREGTHLSAFIFWSLYMGRPAERTYQGQNGKAGDRSQEGHPKDRPSKYPRRQGSPRRPETHQTDNDEPHTLPPFTLQLKVGSQSGWMV